VFAHGIDTNITKFNKKMSINLNKTSGGWHKFMIAFCREYPGRNAGLRIIDKKGKSCS